MDDDARWKVQALKGALAVEGARYVAELSAWCALDPQEDRGVLALRALSVVHHAGLREVIEGAVLCAGSKHSAEARAPRGCVLRTLEIACFAFVRFGHTPLSGMQAVVRAGGDTDAHVAIVGSWLCALHGLESFTGDSARYAAANPSSLGREETPRGV